ncbi:MAG TPA: hypothetical protein VNX68_00440 [Nitrosopumilaceae archaeon]|nr:hypothetical protein [Nitrosopumilaceae archaeon]
MGNSWITDILADHYDVETPESWIYWSLLFTISSVAANAYTLKTLSGKVIYYPNVYIILLGDSGKGKGYPVNLAKRFLLEADVTRVIAGRSSIQAIIKEASTTRSTPGKAIITDSRAAVINGELSSAIIGDPQALEILTDLFDRNYHDKPWVNLLKGDGAERLKEPYFTCLFGSSPAHFYNSIPQHNIQGGYIGRNLVIYEEKRARDLELLNPEGDNTDNNWFIDKAIPQYVPHLVNIASNKMRLIPEEGARKLYNTWRTKWRIDETKYNDKTGFISRVPDHVLKTAMCLCLSRYENHGIIIESDINEAIQKITGLIYASVKVAEGNGIDPLALATRRVMDILIAAEGNQILRRDLLQRGFGDFDPSSLDRIIDALQEMTWVKRERIGVGKNIDYLYKLSGTPKENLDKFRRER